MRKFLAVLAVLVISLCAIGAIPSQLDNCQIEKTKAFNEGEKFFKKVSPELFMNENAYYSSIATANYLRAIYYQNEQIIQQHDQMIKQNEEIIDQLKKITPSP